MLGNVEAIKASHRRLFLEGCVSTHHGSEQPGIFKALGRVLAHVYPFHEIEPKAWVEKKRVRKSVA